MKSHLVLLAVFAVLLLAACQQQPSTADSPPPAATPTPQPAQPTAMLPFTPTPRHTPAAPRPTTPQPTATPSPTSEPLPVVSRLPAPLYFLNTAGQIMRLDAEGKTLSQITDAQEAPIVDFALSPSSGALAYLTEPVSATERVLTYRSAAGDIQREVFRGPLSSPVFVADDPSIAELDPTSTGQRIVYRVFEPLPNVEPARAKPGVFESYDIGMCPYLLLPDDTTTEPASRYTPLSLSPDGSRLLLRVDRLVERTVQNSLAVLQPDETISEITTPEGELLVPGDYAWSQDSTALYVAASVSPGAEPPTRMGLWRADAADGSATLAWPPAGSESPFGAIAFPRQLPNGQIFFFAAEATTTTTPTLTYRMMRLSPEADSAPAVVSSEEWGEWLQWAAWAPDGSGAVVKKDEHLLWVPSDGSGAARIPAEGYHPGGHVAWGYDQVTGDE